MDFNSKIFKLKLTLVNRLETIHDHMMISMIEESVTIIITAIQIYAYLVYSGSDDFQVEQFLSYAISYASKVMRLDFVTKGDTTSIYVFVIHYMFCSISIIQAILLLIKFPSKLKVIFVHLSYLCSMLLLIPMLTLSCIGVSTKITTENIHFVIFSSIAILGLIFSSSLFSIAQTQPYYDLNQGYVRYMSLPSLLYVAMKIGCFISYRFLDTKVLGCVFGVLCLGVSVSRITKMQYYHNIEVEKVNLFTFCSLLCISIIELIKEFMGADLQSMILAPIVMIGFVVSKIIIGYRERIIVKEFKSFLTSTNRDYTNLINLMLYLQTASSRYLISREYLIRYIGICQVYSNNCNTNRTEMVDSLKFLTSSSNTKMNSVSQLHFAFVTSINNIFNDGLKQGRKNSKLLLAYASFLVWSQINTLQSFLIIKGINEKDLSLIECFHLAVIKEHNKKLFAINFDDSQNYSRVIIFENRWKAFKSLISTAAEQFENLWFLLLGSNPDLKILLLTVSQINMNVEEIEQLWETIVSHEVSSNKAIILYSRFERWLMNDLERAYVLYGMMHSLILKKSALQIVKENSKYKICSKLKKQGIAFVTVSTLINKLGIITSCNMATCRLIGCPKSKLVGYHMNIVIPEIYHEGHLNQVSRRERKNTEHYLDIPGFIKHTSGYYQKIVKSFADYPSLMNGSEYIIALETCTYKGDSPVGYIIVNDKYFVEGITSEIIHLLKINKSKSTGNIQINEMLEDYEKTITNQTIDGINFTRESIIMHSKVIGFSIAVCKTMPEIKEKLQFKTKTLPFEFAYCEGFNRYVRQFKCSTEKEDSVSVKIANPNKNTSEQLSETDKKTTNSVIDDGYQRIINVIEESTQHYFQEMSSLLRVIMKYSPQLLLDVKERLVSMLYRKKHRLIMQMALSNINITQKTINLAYQLTQSKLKSSSFKAL